MSIKEDITIEFYYKKAVYISKITKVIVPIAIKLVYRYGNGIIEVVSSNDVSYRMDELCDFAL